MRALTWLGIGLLSMVCLVALLGSLDLAAAQEEAAPEKAAEHGYLGVAGCKMCHKSEAKGAQFTKWETSSHAKAYATLLTDEAKAVATKLGLKESPEKAAQCLKCHVTGHGVKAELLSDKYTLDEGVGCEACHGPGADYKSVHAKDQAQAMTLGMINAKDEKLCKTCHNEESPTYKEFKFTEALAVIAHPIPGKAEGK